MDSSDQPFLIANHCASNRIRFNIPYLSSYFSPREDSDVKFHPSKWKKELAKTSEELSDQISKFVTNRYLTPEFRVPNDVSVRPPLLVFQNVNSGSTSKLSFTITNRSKHALDLNYETVKSEVFQVQTDQITLRRLSPNQSVVVTVKCTPTTEEDQIYVIKFHSKKGSFNIPVLCIGPRFLVSSNDSLMIDEAYINMKSTTLLPLSNLGPRQIDLILLAQPPFTIKPSTMILEPYTSGKVEVTIKSNCIGKQMSKLRIRHSTGEEVFVDLIGLVVVGDITLNKNFVKFPGVYMNTQVKETVVLQSNVHHSVNFSWRRYKTEAEDKVQFGMFQKTLGTVFSSTDRPTFDVNPDILSENVLNKECQLAENYNCFLFDNPHFKIEPLRGSIQPMSTLECSIYFHPEQILPHKMKAFLHIECKMERTELEVEGFVIGPRIDSNISMIDLSICDYLTRRGLEIIFSNNGPIEGTVKYLDEHSKFIICEPMKLRLKVAESKCLVLLIDFTNKGHFLTELKFIIEESGEILTTCLKGTIVGLPIRINREELDFGIVALGYSNSLTFDFFNDGDTCLEYHLLIANDGTHPPLRISQFSKNIRSKFPPFPKEFTITPQQGVIKPKSRISVEVELIPNKYYDRPTELTVIVNGVPVQDLSVPIKYYCHHPMITCTPFEFDLRYLVYNEPTEIEFIMSNEGTAPAAFVLSLIGNAIRITFSKTRGILEPGRSIPITATLTPIQMGSATVVIGVDLFGRSVIEEAVWLNYVCSAPRLSVNPSLLVWHITEDTCSDDLMKQLTITNPYQTPISCRIKVGRLHKHMWRVTPRKAIVESAQVITIKPIIIDNGKSVFTLSVVYSHRDETKLTVYSTVTTAVRSVPTIFNGYDFGNVLKNIDYCKNVKFINLGLKTYTIMSKPREMDIYTNPFTIKPRSFSIKRKEKVEVSLEFRDDTLGPHHSTFDVVILDKRLRKHPLGACYLTANIVPKSMSLSWTPEALELLISSKHVHAVRGTIEVFTSVPCLDEIECFINHPYFSIIENEETIEMMKFTIGPSVTKTVVVQFSPHSCTERRGCFQTKMIMKIKSIGVKKTVDISGEINLPHFTWSSQHVDFGCLYPFQDGHDQITLANETSETLAFNCQYVSVFKTRPAQLVEEKEEDEISWSPRTVSVLSPHPLSPSLAESPITDNESSPVKSKVRTSDRDPPQPRKSRGKGKKKTKKTTEVPEQEPIEHLIDLPPDQQKECVARARAETTGTLIPILNNTIEPSIAVREISQYLRTPVPLDKFNELFLISPMFGEVCPGESITLSVAYLPREPSVSAEAEISLYRDDEYEETFKLNGSCRESFQYEITPLNVDFGIIPFCEISMCDISITNLTDCPMELEVLNIHDEDKKDTRFQRLGTICVKPTVSTVNAHSTKILTVYVHPFILSWFFKKYRIKIHGIQDEILTVQGESSIHFLNLELPPSFEKVAIMDQYNGLRIMYNRLYTQDVQVVKSPSDVCMLSPDDDFGWEIVFEKEIPKNTDLNDGILMGIAEQTSEKHCEEFYQHAIENSRMHPLPHFVLPKQVFDIGGTVVDEENVKTLRISNNSDFDVRYTMSIDRSKTQLRTMGFAINGIDKENHFVRKGKVKEHKMVFHPHSNNYHLRKKLQVRMGWRLTIKVACGPIMTVHITSVVTKPYISVPPSIDFGHVRCNEKLFLKMKITNENVTRCEWSVELTRTFYENFKRRTLRVGAPNPFAIEGPDMNGILGPKLDYELFISFEPPSVGEFLGELRVDVDNKRLAFITELRGFGECPNIEFTPAKIEFEGIVPHSGHSEKVLTICNKGLSPVDLYLPECKEYFMQQFMLRSILNYMQKDVCYVPACTANDTPMSHLHEMFAIVVQKAEDYFMDRGINPIDEYVFVNDYLKILEEENPLIPRDDLAAIVCARVEERRKEQERGSGRLIVFNGAPTVDYIREANRTGTAMRLPVASLDQLIFEEMAFKNTEVASELRVLVDNEFRKIVEDDFGIPPHLAGNDYYKPIIWRMKVEAINKWVEWMEKRKPSKAPSRQDTKKPDATPESQTPKISKVRSKVKASALDKEETEKLDVPCLRIQTNTIQKLLMESNSSPVVTPQQVAGATYIFFDYSLEEEENGRKSRRWFQEMIHEDGLIIDRLSSIVLRDPVAVLSLLIGMTGEQDRVDYVEMFSSLENALARNDLQEAIEKQKEESLKPRFSQICLYEAPAFDALDGTTLEGFFDELKRRYALCHRAQVVDFLQDQKKPKTSGKRKSKVNKSKKKRTSSYTEGQERSSRQSFRSLRSQGSVGEELNEKNLRKMKLMGDFLEYEAQRVEINHFLQGKRRTPSKAQTGWRISLLSDIEQRVNVWILNSEPYEVQSREHELMVMLIGCEEFKMPEKHHEQDTWESRGRYFRLDRPKFINEIDGEIDGLWFPSLTHTFGVYSADKDNPFCIYPIDPANIFCGISRLGFRRSNWWPDEQTVSQFHLEPDEKVSALVVFQPKETGTFEKTLRVNIADWPGQAAGVVIEGVSDILHVDLDLRTIFPPNCYAFEELPVRPSLEVVQQTILEMGPILVPKTKGNKKYKITSYLTFKNISRVSGKILFSLKYPSATFELDTDDAFVKPNESTKLAVHAFPWKEGFRSCFIVVSIEDNPIPIFIEARVEGYVLKATALPPVINLEDILLTQSKKGYFRITNDTWFPIQWKLSETDLVKHPYLKFKTKSGVLNSQETTVSIVTYSPLIVQDTEIVINVLIRQYLDDKSKFEKGPTFTVKISSRDVVVDIQTFTTSGNRILVYEDAYVDTEQSKCFVIGNMSKFPIGYKVMFNADISYNQQKIFTVTPTEGTLPRHHEFSIEVKAKSSKPTCFKALPLLLVEISDIVGNIRITELTISITYCVFHPQYEIRPLEDLSFGNVLVTETRTIDMVIENRGTLPIEYKIMTELVPKPVFVEPPPQKPALKKIHRGRKKKLSKSSVILEPQKLPRIDVTGAQAKKDRRHKKGKKGRNKKRNKKKPKSAPADLKKEESLRRAATVVSEGVVMNVRPRLTNVNRSSILRRSLRRARTFPKKSPALLTPTREDGLNRNKLVAGPFTVENSMNKVNPKETAELRLIFNPQQEGEFQQQFFFDVNQSPNGPQDMVVDGRGVLPSISHTLVEVLRDALINLSPENEQKILEKGFPCNTYHEETHYLELCNYIVGERTPIKFYLVNNGPVTALVQLYFTEVNTESFSFQGNVDKMDVSVPQKTTKPVEFFFTPNSTEMVEVRGHIELVMPKGIENFHFIIQIRGRGHIPQIAVTKPDDYDRTEVKYYLDMGITILDRPAVDYFSFKNIGTVAAKVMVELPNNTGIFSFKARGNYKELLKHQSNDPLIDPFVITMTPGMEIDITVEYTAVSKIMDTCNVYIHVIGNPYEKLVLEIYGRGVSKEVNMDLPLGCVKDIETKLNRRKAISVGKVDPSHDQSRPSREKFYYELDFGSVRLGQFVKKVFSMNNSSYFTIRVSFSQSKLVRFVPSTFHIGPTGSREVIALFKTDEDTIHYEMLDVTFEPIAYMDLKTDVWDNNPKLFQILFNKQEHEIEDKDLLEPQIDEPKFESQSGKVVDRRLNLSVYGRAGIPSLSMVPTLIEFPPTRSFEESTAIVFVRNSGNLEGECTFALSVPTKENWGGMTVSSCSMNPQADLIRQPLETGSTYLNNPQAPEGSPLKKERLGFLYAPTRLPIFDDFNVKSEESSTVQTTTPSIESKYYNPFHVEPETLIVPHGEVRYVKVAFKPKENCSTECSLIASFNDAGVVRQEFCSLQGDILFCPCHIVCEHGKPNFELSPNEDLKVIDVRATSHSADAEKQFELVNVSTEDIEFHFEKRDDTDSQMFHLNPVKGRIGASRMQKIALHFHPSTSDGVNSLWALHIPVFNIEQKILFVAGVTPPIVKITPPAITVPVSINGVLCSKTFEVVNNDEKDFEFNLRQIPLLVGTLECSITPDKGVVQAGSSVSFVVAFTSLSSGNLTIQIACKLKNHDVETIAMIFAEFFELQCMLSLQYEHDQKRKMDPSRTNDIDIGFVEPNNPQSATFILSNFGQGPLRYRWVPDDAQREKQGITINFNRTAGLLGRQSIQALEVTFTVSKNAEFENYVVQLQVYRGPTYTLSFRGHSELPYSFSFKKFNFGNCPVLQTGVCNYIKMLHFTNESDQPLIFENTFSNKPHLRVLWSCGTVYPRETVSTMIEFYPISQAYYREDVVFTINGIISETISFVGKGLLTDVRLSDSHSDTVNLKNVPVKTTRKEIRKVVNYSSLAVECELEVEKREGLLITPQSFVIKKNGYQNLAVSYSPVLKTEPFTSEVFIQAGGTRNFLFHVKCSSSHISVKLDNKVLLLGRAVKYCPVQFSVNIVNDGDIGVSYYWNLNEMKTLLTVTPERGNIKPYSTIQSIFSLLSLKKMTINHKVFLVYNGNQTEELKIVGEFTEIPDPSETINFRTLVRGTVEHTLQLESRTGDPAILFPVLIGDYFSSPDFVEVLSLKKTPYTITYAPLTMTSTAVHSGRLFIPYSDGTCVYYALIGEALPPEPEEILDWTILSKIEVSQTFEVTNWLNEFQRLCANVTLDDADKIQPGIVSIMGEPTVCLSPNVTALYTVDVMVCKAMSISFKVFFVNPDSKEYRYYIVHVVALPLPEAPMLEVRACIHDSARALVKLSNPFIEPVTFKFHSPAPELTADDVTVQPRSEGELKVKYAPGAIETPKVITCRVTGQPLDDESITFHLVPMPLLDQPPLKVSALIGSSTNFSFDVFNAVQNAYKQKITCNVYIEGDELSVVGGTEFEIPAQKQYSLELNYEPSEVGSKEQHFEVHFVTSEVLKYNVFTTCHPPQPVGPIKINAGSQELIQFKNVFNEVATFSLTTTENMFTVAIQRGEMTMSLPGVFSLESKETALISIELREGDLKEHRLINNFPIADKMEITLTKRGNYMFDEKDTIRWVYYLKGLQHVDDTKAILNTPEVSESVSFI